MNNKIKLSILDLAIVADNTTVNQTLNQTTTLAQFCEKLGFERFWMAEHHNMEHIASSATSVMLSYVGSKTEKIRVGSGGVMLPNHSPLVIAEQFGTLESLFPGRVDLGLGRAPGTDGETAMAIRSDFYAQSQQFPRNVSLLQQYLSADNSSSKVRAFPGEGLSIPIWILGSSTESAALAAAYGLPYAFAGHFAPKMMYDAFKFYTENYRPSPENPEPYTMACVNAIAAETTEEAEFLSTSLYQNFLNIIRNTRQPMQAPDLEVLYGMNDIERFHVEQMLNCSFIGDAQKITEELKGFINKTQVNEIMITSQIYDFDKRLQSTEIMQKVMQNINNDR
ncbi:LLM class flavin-dependent oxidoreductase [Flavobacterium agricola]|uniref:LLM class flavin-dependent oxidoreductase n=1 Tax=Flavobacterium agricola TaxID=2870839 RepID=A0ABY6M1B0_9FLAO|nr:LLM class flavin-dependent oxidoreductase [Flavobacterium agricola]UYW01449.1 LLM class flavin-dependent oxidoreductase [Flavobacterium agricola]